MAHAKADPNAKFILHSVFTSQDHAPTEDAFKPAILRSSGARTQKSVFENDDAKQREREERLPGPGTGAGPMEVGGGAAAVVESGSAWPPSEGVGVGGIGQGRGCGRRWRSVGAGTGGVGQRREDPVGEVRLRWSSTAGKGRSPPAEKSAPGRTR